MLSKIYLKRKPEANSVYDGRYIGFPILSLTLPVDRIFAPNLLR